MKKWFQLTRLFTLYDPRVSYAFELKVKKDWGADGGTLIRVPMETDRRRNYDDIDEDQSVCHVGGKIILE